MGNPVIVDTNIFVSALLKADTAPRQIIRLCFLGEIQPLMGNALFSEYEELSNRKKLFENSLLSHEERLDFLADFMSVCKWVSVYYLWRPNLRDEADNHLLELAIAGNASHIITGNTKDFEHAELLFPEVKIVTARQFIEERTL